MHSPHCSFSLIPSYSLHLPLGAVILPPRCRAKLDGVTAESAKWRRALEDEKAMLSEVVGNRVQPLELGRVYYVLPR